MTNKLESLINELLKNIIKEASYTQSDVPKYFWLMTNLDRDTDYAKQLANGELKGVKGISSSKEIIGQWIGGRNTIIMMPSNKFLELNNVSRIMYDNPNYLVSKDMSALFRILARPQDEEVGRTGIMQTIVEYIYKFGMQYFSDDRNRGKYSDFLTQVFYRIEYGTYGVSRYGRLFYESGAKINSIKELSKWFRWATIELVKKYTPQYIERAEEITTKELEPIIYDAIMGIGRIYKSESEWVIKGDSIKIPTGSTIMFSPGIYLSEKDKNDYENGGIKNRLGKYGTKHYVIEALNDIKYFKELGLDKKYNFNVLDNDKLENFKKRFRRRTPLS